MLDERKKRILAVMVENYVDSAEPIGSKSLVERYGLAISPATARCELAALEEAGYLDHEHTSAGRRPTEKGYRYYVNNIMSRGEVSVVQSASIAKAYSSFGKRLDELLRYTSEVLSELTMCASVVIPPVWRDERIKHIDIVPMAARDALLVVITRSGLVNKEVFSVSRTLKPVSWERVERSLNAGLRAATDPVSGQSSTTVDESLTADEALVAAELLEEARRSLKTSSAGEIYSSGAANLLLKPEFEAVEKVQRLFSMIEEGWQVLAMLSDMAESYKVWVSIGSENRWLKLDDCSLVASSYKVGGKAVGALTILGPTRMDYARAVSAVGLVSENLGSALDAIVGSEEG